MRNKTDAKQRVVVVTGSSRGIGIETSLSLAENGFTVYATVRNIDKASNLMDVTINRNLSIKVVQLDITNDTSVRQAIQYIVERGHIDLLINNASYTQLGSVEDLSSEEVQSQFNTKCIWHL